LVGPKVRIGVMQETPRDREVVLECRHVLTTSFETFPLPTATQEGVLVLPPGMQ
jgi:hypothetical protein